MPPVADHTIFNGPGTYLGPVSNISRTQIYFHLPLVPSPFDVRGTGPLVLGPPGPKVGPLLGAPVPIEDHTHKSFFSLHLRQLRLLRYPAGYIPTPVPL